MIAIVILGIGLLTIAAMFPIAWTKARDLADFTYQTSITDSAEVTLRSLTQMVQDTNGDGVPDATSSFIGDFGVATDASLAGVVELDPYVHVLHVENLSFEDGWSDARVWPAFNGPPRVGEYYTTQYLAPGGDAVVFASPDLSYGVYPGGLPLDAAPGPQIAFYQRVFPPLPPPEAVDWDGTTAGAKHWQELLQNRRLCWAVLHKLNNFDDIDALPVPQRVSPPRSFTIYYVTLRRGQSTHRYFRQDPGDNPAADPQVPGYPKDAELDTLLDPTALDAEEDVMFPVAWRVQITLVDADPANTAAIGMPGVPSQAMVTGKVNTTELLVAEMMPRGSYLIDERTGDMYRVANHELSQTAPYESALLTFDEAIDGARIDNGDGNIEPWELQRTVWVYPPAVERDADGQLVGFAGPQPVVGIEVRTMDFWP